MRALAYLLIGNLFGLGLVVSGMSNPAKVLNFLDLTAIRTSQWDPSLAFVLTGAVLVAAIGYRLLRNQDKPLLAGRFQWPTSTTIDARLLAGAAIFGIGWGMAGFCPGPAFTTLAIGSQSTWAFVLSMMSGILAARAVRHRL
jgi:uncharacterized membrane protein YedE/YeeE